MKTVAQSQSDAMLAAKTRCDAFRLTDREIKVVIKTLQDQLSLRKNERVMLADGQITGRLTAVKKCT